MEKLGRLVKILLLIQANGSLTAQELAEKFEVSVRTIYRDIEALTLWGVPIIAEAGHQGGYSLPENYKVDPSMFSESEATSLGVGSTLLEGFTDFIEDPKDLEFARAKLLAALPERDRLLVGRQIRYIYFDNSRWYKDYVYIDALKILKQAVLNNKQILLEFHERNDPLAEKKLVTLVEPYGLVFKSDTWYLVGYSHSSNQIRRWNVLRIIKCQLTNTEFIRRPNFSLREWWERELEDFGKGNIRVLLRIDKLAWNRFSRFKWKKDNRFFDMGDHIVVEMIVDQYEWLVDVIMVNRGNVEILEPPELRQKIASVSEIISLRHKGKTHPIPDDQNQIDFEVLGFHGDQTDPGLSAEMERD